MKKIIVFPGRFQPALGHHIQVFKALQGQFPDADVYIATTDKVDGNKSPFNFKEKQQIMAALGVPADKILQVRNPYNKDDYTQYFDENSAALIIAVGEKDLGRFPFNNADPKTGLDMAVKNPEQAKYFQKINTYNADPRPMSERGYITLAPTVTSGAEIASASAFRAALLSAPDVEAAKEIVAKQYGQHNEKIFNLLYQKIKGTSEMKKNNDKAILEGLFDSFNRELEEGTRSVVDKCVALAAKYYNSEGLQQQYDIADYIKSNAGTDPAVDKCAALAAKYFNSAGLQQQYDIADYIKSNAGVEEGYEDYEDWNDNDSEEPNINMCPECEGEGTAHGETCTTCGGEGAIYEGDIAEEETMDYDTQRMRHLAGLQEAPVQFDAPKKPRKKAVAHKTKQAQAQAQHKRTGSDDISPKDRREAEGRPAAAAASNPDKVRFLPATKDGIKNSIANFFPGDVDVNDPTVKKENFIKAIQKAPAILFGEINSRLVNDDNGLAVSDRLSDIVGQFESGENINSISPEDKEFAMKLAIKALSGMDLSRPGYGSDDESGEDGIGVDHEYDDDADATDAIDDPYNDDEYDEDVEMDEGAKCSHCRGTGEEDGQICQWCGGSGADLDEGLEEAGNYNAGDEVVINGQWYVLQDDEYGNLVAVDQDGGEIEFTPGIEDDHTPAMRESACCEKCGDEECSCDSVEEVDEDYAHAFTLMSRLAGLN